MARAVSSIETSPSKPRKPRKGGALTRAQRTRSLRKRAGFSVKRLMPRGLAITFDQTTGLMNLAEILHAEAQQRGGKARLLSDWMRLSTTPGYLEAVGLSMGIPIDSLINRSHGKEPWGHPLVAVDVARWLSPSLRVAINRLWMETVNGKPRRPKRSAEQKLLQAQRGQAHRSLTDVLQDKGIEGQEYQRVLRQVTFLLTGHAPEHWQKELEAKNWLSKATPEFQRGMVLVRQTLAGHYRRLDLASKTEGKVRWFNLEAKEVMPELLGLLEFWGLPRSPLPDGAAPMLGSGGF